MEFQKMILIPIEKYHYLTQTLEHGKKDKQVKKKVPEIKKKKEKKPDWLKKEKKVDWLKL
jgi:hypothetical protein